MIILDMANHPERSTIISSNMCFDLHYIDFFGDAKFAILLWQPSEQNTYVDIEAVYKCLQENYGTNAENIILYGQSVGSGPTLDLATQLSNIRAVVLHSPILSGLRVMYPVKHSYWFDIYKNIDKVPRVTCPVLIIHLLYGVSNLCLDSHVIDDFILVLFLA
ncbi:hypothetical protein MA16_Dca027934 [Dendrobium catenatum]|uniref:Uncharacterized protein n=1 Tax=Dendrobium catenatum TaxID=906689 RepID=A0A2I0VAR4_9ASPA|nr:hypothetical protein MA16_Dca027934 [Dendrobium catenatum]